MISLEIQKLFPQYILLWPVRFNKIDKSFLNKSNFQKEYYLKKNIISTYSMISEFNYTINSLLENIGLYLGKSKAFLLKIAMLKF